VYPVRRWTDQHNFHPFLAHYSVHRAADPLTRFTSARFHDIRLLVFVLTGLKSVRCSNPPKGYGTGITRTPQNYFPFVSLDWTISGHLPTTGEDILVLSVSQLSCPYCHRVHHHSLSCTVSLQRLCHIATNRCILIIIKLSPIGERKPSYHYHHHHHHHHEIYSAPITISRAYMQVCFAAIGFRFQYQRSILNMPTVIRTVELTKIYCHAKLRSLACFKS